MILINTYIRLVTTAYRALLVGLFNSVEEWIGLDVAAGEQKPGFGLVDFSMHYVVHRPCGRALNPKS